MLHLLMTDRIKRKTDYLTYFIKVKQKRKVGGGLLLSAGSDTEDEEEKKRIEMRLAFSLLSTSSIYHT